MEELSDYYTASEFKEDFASDDEPPQDKIQEKKMIYKGKDLRIYKEILRIGERTLDKTAPIDYVDFNLIKIDEENPERHQLFLGLDTFSSQDWIKISLISMKRKEVAKFELEWLSKDQNKSLKLVKKDNF